MNNSKHVLRIVQFVLLEYLNQDILRIETSYEFRMLE